MMKYWDHFVTFSSYITQRCLGDLCLLFFQQTRKHSWEISLFFIYRRSNKGKNLINIHFKNTLLYSCQVHKQADTLGSLLRHLSVRPSVCLAVLPSVCPEVRPSAFKVVRQFVGSAVRPSLPGYSSICLLGCLSICLPDCPFIYLPGCPSICLPDCPSIGLPACRPIFPSHILRQSVSTGDTCVPFHTLVIHKADLYITRTTGIFLLKKITFTIKISYYS